MKRLVYILMTVCLLLGMASCADKPSQEEESTVAITTATPTTTTGAPTDTDPPTTAAPAVVETLPGGMTVVEDKPEWGTAQYPN